MTDRGFYERVYELLAEVPSGRVCTYGQLARLLGRPRAARAVGWAMRHCPEGLPWHRVVNAKGQISERSHYESVPLQRLLLEDEGVVFDEEGTIDLDRYQWDGC